MTRTSPSSGLLDTFLSGNSSKACFDSQKTTYFGIPGLGFSRLETNPRRRSQCLCESSSMASGLCFKLVYLGVGPSPKWRPSKSQGCQSLGLHSGGGFFQGWSPGVEVVFFVQIFKDFFLKKVGGKHFLVEKSRWNFGFPERNDPDHCKVKLILEILLLLYFMKWCHVQCRSLKTHVIEDICLSLIQRVTFHEKSRGLVEFTLYGKPFFQHEEHVFVG